MAFLFDLKALVDMMSIGTLLAYSLVAACVLILRYQPDAVCEKSKNSEEKEDVGESELTESESHLNMLKDGGTTLHSLLNPPLLPTEKTSTIVNVSVNILVIAVCVVSTLNTYYGQAIIAMEPWALGLLAASLLVFFLCILLVYRQPQTKKKVSFMVPLLPFLPILSIFVNVYLMVQLSGDTWIRFSIWMAIGFVIYFGYGMWHSTERKRHLQNCGAVTEKKKLTADEGPEEYVTRTEKTSPC